MHQVLFTSKARTQYLALDGRLKRQVDKGIGRIAKSPRSGKPLGKDLKGVWSERVSTFRILYKIIQKRVEILVLVIEHRRSVYGGH